MARFKRPRRGQDQPRHRFRSKPGDPRKQAASVMRRLRGTRIRSVGTVRSYQERLAQVAARLDMERQAIQAMLHHVTMQLPPGSTLPVVKADRMASQSPAGVPYSDVTTCGTHSGGLLTESIQSAPDGARSREMSQQSPTVTGKPAPASSSSNPPQPNGANPGATGGAGVTFERKVAAQYLAHLLTGSAAPELGDGRRVASVSFQQAPEHAVDDLVVHARHPDGLHPTLVLALGVRRAPRVIQSDESSQKLFLQFVRATIDEPSDDTEYRFGLVVSGPVEHANQLAQLADLAVGQMDSPGLFRLVNTPGKFASGLRRRLKHLTKLVDLSLRHLGAPDPDARIVEERTWQLLSRLKVLMPRLETPDETDWAAVATNLSGVARHSEDATSSLRDRLLALAGDYSSKAARVDLTILRRDCHVLLDTKTRRHRRGWRTLERIDDFARDAVLAELTGRDGNRSMHLERNDATEALAKVISGAQAVVVSGESGVGKSALAVRGLTAKTVAERDRFQIVCLNLRHIPPLPIDFENALGQPLSAILAELSAPQRLLVIDGADAATEDKHDAFRYLVRAARDSGTKVVAVTSTDSKQVVLEALYGCFDTADVEESGVPPLTDADIEKVVETFPDLRRLSTNPRSRELLRRLVVAQLLVRGRISGTPLTDADAMKEIWSGLIRRRGSTDRGSPDAREAALLRLAELELGKGERLDVVSSLDSVAVDGLRRDGLLMNSADNPFGIGPEFGHDEIRRYAVAWLLLASGDPSSALAAAGAPRWSLAAARLACQARLALPDTPAAPLNGRVAAEQASFDRLVAAGHGSRWGDVPSEALLTLSDPGPLLRDAWPAFLADGAAGLRRLVRLADQRHRDEDGVIDTIVVEPLVGLLLDAPTPWRSGDHAETLLRAWLRAHVISGTAEGHPLRIVLRRHLVEACHAADVSCAAAREAAATEPNTPKTAITQERREFIERLDRQSRLLSSLGESRGRRRRPDVPSELKNRLILELLALLGPDLGEEGEAILRRVANDAPTFLAPAVDELLTGDALAGARRGLLAELTEAYYLDDEPSWFHSMEDGIRRHLPKGLALPQVGRHRGPFLALLRTDFRNGVAVLNRLLNHATRIRVRSLTQIDKDRPLRSGTDRPYEHELSVTGEARSYVGDKHAWRWYRGNAVGPYPCVSALQALEAECDRLIQAGVPIATLVSILLDGCENLAMVGLIVGLLVRHLEDAHSLLDPYIVEPTIWLQEFARAPEEASGLSATSDHLVSPERRRWTLHNAAMLMALRATGDRVAELDALGKTLIDNARQHVEADRLARDANDDAPTEHAYDALVVQARAWASSLDRNSFKAERTPDGLTVEATPPPDVVEALHEGNQDLERAQDAIRLFDRYHIEPTKEMPQPVSRDDLVADIAAALELVENPPTAAPHSSWDTAASVASAALEAHLIEGVDLPDDAVRIALEIILLVGDASPRRDEYDGAFYEFGADRSAAKVIPLILSITAPQLRALPGEDDESTMRERAIRGALNLARTSSYEVRLFLARGLDHLWTQPCTEDGPCHHELGWQIATETARNCLRGPWDSETGHRSVLALDEPFNDAIADAAADSIIVSRLDGAIRALAPAATASICISSRARDLLHVLFAAQRRALLEYEHGDPDERESHTLVAARALLTLAEDCDDDELFEHINAYAENSHFLGKTLTSLSAAAEETPSRAATAQRIWPKVIRHVLDMRASTRRPARDSHFSYFGDRDLADLIPNPVGELPYVYRELHATPIKWWNPLELRVDVATWLQFVIGSAMCVDRLVAFIRRMDLDDQVRVGLPWIAVIVLDDPAPIACGAYTLTTWLIETRSAAVDTGLLSTWQEVVDALVVEGDSRLAPYSD